MKSPKAKSAEAPIHLDDFGCVNALLFDGGGSARVQMNVLEIQRIMEALQRYVLRKHKIPDTKVLAALDTLHEYFESGGRAYDVTITADMVIAAHGVTLEPIL